MRLRKNGQSGGHAIMNTQRISRREPFRVTNVTEWEIEVRVKTPLNTATRSSLIWLYQFC